jgi:hypothetical protein
MKVVTNTKLIKRNSRIGQVTTIGALAILGLGLFITFKMPDKFSYSLVALLAGFFLSQVGMYYGNRWGRSPRPDELINKGMKGLGREYTIYHYTTPASHLLVGPAGVWVVMPYHQGGTILYDGKRWRSKGGGFARSYMRIFGQESMGRPDLESDAEIQSVKRHLTRLLPEGTALPEIRAVLLFTDPKAELQIENAPIPTMKPDGLKDFLKRAAKEKPIGELALTAVRSALPKPEKEEE